MNIMIRDPYYLAKTVLGSYNLYILKDPFGSWHYSCVGTFNTKDEAIDYYHVNTTKYIQLKYSLSHLTITIISMPTK